MGFFYVDKTHFIKEWWESKGEKYRQLQGTYPVISLTFANVKETSFENTKIKIKKIVKNLILGVKYFKVPPIYKVTNRKYYIKSLQGRRMLKE